MQEFLKSRRAEFIADWRAGMPVMEMAEKYGCSPGTISNTAVGLGQRRRKNGPPRLGKGNAAADAGETTEKKCLKCGEDFLTTEPTKEWVCTPCRSSREWRDGAGGAEASVHLPAPREKAAA